MQLTILGGISIIMTAIMQFLVSVLQANGLYKYSLLFNLLGGSAKVLFLFIFAPIKEVSVYAVAISNILLSLIVSICVLIKLWKLIKIPLVEIFLPIVSAVIMFLSVKVFLTLVGGITGILLSVIIGMGLYFVFTLPLLFKYYDLFKEKLFKRRCIEIE